LRNERIVKQEHKLVACLDVVSRVDLRRSVRIAQTQRKM